MLLLPLLIGHFLAIGSEPGNVFGFRFTDAPALKN